MIFTVPLSGLILVCLFSLSSPSVLLEGETVDIETLARIIHFIDHQGYKVQGQYAVTINVPKEQCQRGFWPSKDNFLIYENVTYIINAHKEWPVYEGKELIAAGVQKKPHPAHSEFLLMNRAMKSPLTHLLNHRRDGCVIFYTLNSPCMDTCLNGRHNIIPGLDELKAYQGMKAFVFKSIWGYDNMRRDKLSDKLKLIADRVPLYRCKNIRNGIICTLCGKQGSRPAINGECLTPH